MTWDYHLKDYKKQANVDPVWHLERMIRYGLGGEKIRREDLKKYLPELKIAPQQKIFLQLLLDETHSPHPGTKKRHQGRRP